jgi:hypothetical protein
MFEFASELVEQPNLDVDGTVIVSARDIRLFRHEPGDHSSVPLE